MNAKNVDMVKLSVLATHPIQYHAPVYRCVQRMGIDVTAIYGSDFSVSQYHDTEFGVSFTWDVDLISGYSSRFLKKVADGAPSKAEQVRAFGLQQVLREEKPDVLLVTGYRTVYHRQALSVALRSGIPIVFRGEATDHALMRSWPKRVGRQLALRALYSRFGACLFTGEHGHAHFVAHGVPEEKLLFSPYCVETAPFRITDADRSVLRGETRTALDIGAEQRVLLFSGKLSDRKGVDVLLDAVKTLPTDQRESLTILYLGDGALRSELERKAAMEPVASVRFTGFQPQQAISSFYMAADVLVLPSRHSETWGLVVNEALHHGLPAIATTRVGSAPDLIEPGRTGEVCEPGSVASLRAAIDRWLLWQRGDAQERTRCRDKVAPYSVDTAASAIVQTVHRLTRS